MTTSLVTVGVTDGVAHLELNRPEAANAINLALARDLMESIAAITEDRRVRSVLLTGAGSSFCGGGDLKEFESAGEGLPAHLKLATGLFHSAVARLARLAVPVVGAMQGTAFGPGLSLTLAVDIAIAAQSTKFCVGYTGVGMTTDGGLSWHLSRAVGLPRALDLMLSNRVLSAAEAMDLGLIARVVEDRELESTALKMAQRLAAGPHPAQGQAKALLRTGMSSAFEQHLETESQIISDMARTVDGAEGLSAFAEGRRPNFGAS
jgi:2-(1,2-epoxy-1,2-dihydrophenyl)acetyl-CoA isomerase